MNILLEMEQKSKITQAEKDLIKTKKLNGKLNDFLLTCSEADRSNAGFTLG